MKHLLLIGLTTSLLLAASHADAAGRNRQRSGTYSGDRGQNATWQRQTEADRGSRNQNTQWQNAKGNGTRDKSTQWNRENGTAQQSIDTTLPDGRSSSLERTGQKTGDQSWQVDSARAGFNGREQTGSKAITKTGEGTASVQGNFQGEKGKSLSTQAQVVKTDSGLSKTGTYTTGNGKTGEFSSSASHESGQVTREKSLTTDGGKSVSKTVTTQATENGATRTVTTTGPDGETRTHSGTVDVDQPPGEKAPE